MRLTHHHHEAKRTSPLALWRYAHDYLRAAQTLARQNRIACHESQMSAYEQLKNLPPEDHQAIWGKQSFYRVFSLVNGGRVTEHDLFEGLR